MSTKKSNQKKETVSNPVEEKTAELIQETVDLNGDNSNVEPDVEQLPDREPGKIHGTISEKVNRVIFLVITKNEDLAILASQAIKKYFTGEIEAIVPNFDDSLSLVDKVTDFISRFENEQFILMDGIVPVNRFTLGDVQAVYGVRDRHGWNHNVHTPVLLERIKIVELLEEFPDISDQDFIQKYVRKFHGDLLPVITDWKTDTFTLPIVSENPSSETLRSYLPDKRWFYISDKSAIAMLKFFNEA